MENFGIKATLYDIVGYLLPGAALVVGIWFMRLPDGAQTVEKLSAISLSWPSAVLLLGFTYVIGHALSALSWMAFENDFVGKVMARHVTPLGEPYISGARRIFGCDPTALTGRIMIAHCQVKNPALYETAFVFLAIGGLSRTMAMCAMILLVHGLLCTGITWTAAFILFGSFAVLLVNTFRFRRYFKEQISASLAIPDGTKLPSGKVD
jgi:hypothetical protein